MSTLHHHQQVEGGGALLLWGIAEVPGGLFDESFEFAGEEHVGTDVVAVGRTIVGGITHGKREGVDGRGGRTELQTYLVERTTFGILCRHGEGLCRHIVEDEEHALCKHAAGCIVECQLIDACQLCLRTAYV